MARVLIVEDEKPLRSMAEYFFKAAGHEVTACADCTQAVAALKSQAHSYDLLVSDWNYPGLGENPNPKSGGRELLQYLKSHPGEAPGDIAIMSGNQDAAATGVILSALEPVPPVYSKPDLFNARFKVILDRLNR